MPGFSIVARHLRQTAIAFALCLLVLSCAMEAKFAWYAPPATPSIDARSTKAIPSDPSESATDDSVTVDATRTGISCFFCAVLAAMRPPAEKGISENWFRSSVSRVPSDLYFSPQISFRPPPGWQRI